MGTLKQHLEMCAKLGARVDAFLLEFGGEYQSRELPAKYKAGKLGRCFENAALLAMANDSLTYVEGYAAIENLGSIPVHHAWCIDSNCHVVDVTWPSDEKKDYIGIPIPVEVLRSELLRLKQYGVLWVKSIRQNTMLIKKLEKHHERADYRGNGRTTDRRSTSGRSRKSDALASNAGHRGTRRTPHHGARRKEEA